MFQLGARPAVGRGRWSDVLLIHLYVVDQLDRAAPLHRRQLDLFRVGDVEAATLGMSVSCSRLIIVVAATLGTGGGGVGERSHRLRRVVFPHVIRLVAERAIAGCCRCR